jgi:hypothetical protein
MRGRGRTADVARAASLAAALAIVFVAATGRTRLDAWKTPILYRGDTWSFLAGVKAARDGHVQPLRPIVIPELNAPSEARWNDYPNRQPTLLWATGVLARLVGLFAAANLVLLFAHVLAGLAFYAAARYLRVRWEWAWVGAAAFALCPYIFYRSLGHLSLSLFWPIPLGILVAAGCARAPGIVVRSRRGAFALAVVVVLGLGNVYYAGLMALFLLVAAAVQGRRRRWHLALTPVVLVGAMAVAAAADNAHYLVERARHGPNPGVFERPYGNLERFALKPIELLLPAPGTSWAPWRGRSSAYWEGALYRGEMGSAYLGLAGALALLGLATAAFGRRRTRRPQPTLLAVGFILIVSVVGGLNGLAGLGGFAWLRATNRYSVWILALVLLAAATRLSRLSWPRGARVLAAALALVVVLGDQVPRAAPQPVDDVRRTLASDEAFVRATESAVPPFAMVFLLPVVDYPEGRPVHRLGEYEHFRPYLFSSRLRFSYGTDKGRPGDDWAHALEGLPARDAAARLLALGFSGLILNRKGFADGGDAWLAGLAAAGRPETVRSSDGDLVLVRLTAEGEPAPTD